MEDRHDGRPVTARSGRRGGFHRADLVAEVEVDRRLVEEEDRRSSGRWRRAPGRRRPQPPNKPAPDLAVRRASRIGDHPPMRIADFALERFFARWEFAVRASALRRRTSRAGRWPSCSRSPTTRPRPVGRPAARLHRVDRPPAAAGARSPACTTRSARRRARLRRRRGGDLLPADVLARAGRPRDRDLARLPEPVRGRPGGRRRGQPPRAPRGGRLGARCRPAHPSLKPATRLVVVNAPHNPTGMLPDRPSGGVWRDRRRGGPSSRRRRGLPVPRVRRGRSTAGRGRRAPDAASRSG